MTTGYVQDTFADRIRTGYVKTSKKTDENRIHRIRYLSYRAETKLKRLLRVS